jgi:hypothetical protein
MKVTSHHQDFPVLPRTLARAIEDFADREGLTLSQALKRLILAGLAAEGEPIARPKRIFSRIDTGIIADDDVAL